MRYFMILLFLFITACATNEKSSPLPQPAPTDTGVLYVAPVDLFSGDAKKFEAFLGSDAGAVALEYEGPKTNMKVETEIWENGKKVQTVQSMVSNIEEGEGKGKFKGEFIISAQQVQGMDENFEYDLNLVLFQQEKGYTSMKGTIPKDKKYTAQMPIKIDGKMDVPEDESVVVWGIQATDQNSLSSYSSVEETLNKARWALIARISLDDEGK
ncbi:hypothetical protein [Ammoniphilus resinae]|uniref:Lipoprotein n=1 Tax=Ammoniphilus resinae TaxID=861532 RepID=A0ABS4GU98_9BACL|nr:hypothetical protein [Ammoniphilus resinae]MBP1933838.1 hypothetical protein [Ammoniphilus resinae]